MTVLIYMLKIIMSEQPIQKYIVECTNLKTGWNRNGTCKKQDIFNSMKDAANYILSEIFSGDIMCEYGDISIKLLGLENISTSEEFLTFVSDCNIIEWNNKTYQVKHVYCNSQKRYFVNEQCHASGLDYQEGFDTLEQAVDTIMKKHMCIDKSGEYTPEYRDGYYFVQEHEGKLYYLNSENKTHAYTEYNTLFDESKYVSAPKTISELKEWFRNFKVCILDWANCGSRTIYITELYV